MIIMESLAQSFVYQLCLHCPGYREHQSGLCLGYQRIGGRALPLHRGRSLGVCSATLGGAGWRWSHLEKILSEEGHRCQGEDRPRVFPQRTKPHTEGYGPWLKGWLAASSTSLANEETESTRSCKSCMRPCSGGTRFDLRKTESIAHFLTIVDSVAASMISYFLP